MEFPYREIHAFEDAQGNFEFLAGVLNQPQGLALSFLQLLSAQKLRLAFGLGSVAMTAGSKLSGTTTINHGLGGMPQAIFLTGGDGTNHLAWAVFNQGAATFQVNGYDTDQTPGGGFNIGFYWAALG